MAKIKWKLDLSTLPKSITKGNEEYEINGCFRSSSPRALFCRCGAFIRADERKENNPSWDGFECPECGHVFSQTDVLDVGWYCAQFKEHHVYKTTLDIVLRQYISHIDKSTHTMTIENASKVEASFNINSADLFRDPNKLTMDAMKMISEKGEMTNVHIKVLVDFIIRYRLPIGRKNVSNPIPLLQRSFAEIAEFMLDVEANNPAIICEVWNEIMNCGVNIPRNYTYEKYEAEYPNYMRPLNPKVVHDWQMYYEKRRGYTSRATIPMSVPEKCIDNTNLVFSYYMMGLISKNQFEEIINKYSVLSNPNFSKFFKSNYVQAGSYIDSLVEENKDLSTDSLDIKNWYLEKNMKFFVEQGYTEMQVCDAINSGNGNYLDVLIAMGSTRRLKGAAKA